MSFKFNNISSLDMGVIPKEVDFTAKASQQVNVNRIEGKNESEFIPLGYEELDLDMVLQLIDISKESAVYAWLNGEGLLEFNGKITKAYFYSSIQFTRDASIKIGNVSFIRSPFWHLVVDDFIIITNEITNIGTHESQPIIRLEKNTTSTVDVTIGGVRFNYDFGSDDYVEIDCESGKVTYDGLYRYGQINIGFDLPILPVGESAVVVHSGDAVIKVKRKDRWL